MTELQLGSCLPSAFWLEEFLGYRGASFLSVNDLGFGSKYHVGREGVASGFGLEVTLTVLGFGVWGLP